MKLAWIPFLLVFLSAEAAGAAIASGRHWHFTVDELGCPSPAQLVIGARIRYLSPQGLVEAPLIRVVDGAGNRRLPRSLVWRKGDKKLADWLSGGGVTMLPTGPIGEVQIRFDVGEAGALRLEFGDAGAFALTSKDAQRACSSLLKVDALRPPRALREGGSEPKMRVYREVYPCRPPKGEVRTIEATQPPHAPRQLVVLGRGYLPNIREIALPTGPAPAQPYAHNGLDTLDGIEATARRAIGADFAQYAAPRYFAFNWGVQKTASGNEIYAIGLYDLRPCSGDKS